MVVQLVLFGVYENSFGDKVVITRLTDEKVDYKISSADIITEAWDVSKVTLQDLLLSENFHLSSVLWQDI